MRKWMFSLLAASLLIPSLALADDFFDLVGAINSTARINLPGFKADVSAEFGIPVPRIDKLLSIVPDPGDVYMSIQLGNTLRLPPEEILVKYKGKKDKGWGVLAQELGIKPGSPEFHALKNGKYAQKSKGHKGGGEREGGKEKGHGNDDKGKGKGKGKNK